MEDFSNINLFLKQTNTMQRRSHLSNIYIYMELGVFELTIFPMSCDCERKNVYYIKFNTKRPQYCIQHEHEVISFLDGVELADAAST
jgi:hypothetical protein